MRPVEEVGYEARLSKLRGGLRAGSSVLTEPAFSLWCGSDNLNDERLASSHQYCVKDIDFKVGLRRHADRKLFVGGIKS